MICAIHQAVFLLKRQIESQGRRFLREGGFSENMYRQRQKARQRRSDQSDRSDRSDGSDRSDRSDAHSKNSPG
jgi:four helix bundle suffix protein